MRMLVVAPHADDEVLGVGGTIAKYIDKGYEVYVCVVTSGHPSMFPEDLLKKLRSEALNAHKFLGIKDTFFLDFPAVMLNEIPVHEVNIKVLDVINEVQPDIVFIPHYGDMHLDHYIVSQTAMVGLRPIREHKVLEIYSYETLSETEWNIPHTSNAFLPNTWIDISDYLDRKLEAMSIYSTQVKEFPHPRSLEAIKALAKLRGSTIGVSAAEAFSLIRRIVL
jgi:LmbE family N-acetylglucosaminyl deacetylase